MTTNWIEEFKSMFTTATYRVHDNGYIRLSPSEDKRFITFITTLLEKQGEEYVEIVKKHKKTYQYEDEVVVNTCDDIINLLKSHDKTS